MPGCGWRPVSFSFIVVSISGVQLQTGGFLPAGVISLCPLVLGGLRYRILGRGFVAWPELLGEFAHLFRRWFIDDSRSMCASDSGTLCSLFEVRNSEPEVAYSECIQVHCLVQEGLYRAFMSWLLQPLQRLRLVSICPLVVSITALTCSSRIILCLGTSTPSFTALTFERKVKDKLHLQDHGFGSMYLLVCANGIHSSRFTACVIG